MRHPGAWQELAAASVLWLWPSQIFSHEAELYLISCPNWAEPRICLQYSICPSSLYSPLLHFQMFSFLMLCSCFLRGTEMWGGWKTERVGVRMVGGS